jgi:endonuclease/exonuclease/phosphatase family metal-dependent hydrolase
MCNARGDLRDVTAHISVTFHGFQNADPVKIDYIFMSHELASCVKDAAIWDDTVNGTYLSDHYPVCAELEF